MTILKWAGGKRQLVERLLPLVVSSLRHEYVEPFLGGGALAFALPERVSARVGDAEVDLMRTYRCIAKTPLSVARALEAHVAVHSSEHYYRVRASSPTSTVDKAARFVYLNRTCFNGLHRKNSRGQFNVPFGRGRVWFPSAEDLTSLSERLRRFLLWQGDFGRLVNASQRGDVIFADPPYDGTFSSYTRGGFGTDEQCRLAESLRRAYWRGVSIISTNASTPLIQHLYQWANVEAIDERRRIAANGDRRAAPCVLITALHS